ncbi:zinc finger protein 3 homolog [Lytechinus pictus]|uniref:zinc finger protein 3 homolog n=1 Tax=Lytechinus pictus TaxID=7653 RepID=UPI0030B9FB67
MASTNNQSIFGSHVETTLFLAAIHRCKICNFYSADSGEIGDHVKNIHIRGTGEEGEQTRIPEGPLEQRNSETPFKTVLNEIQNLQCLKSFPKDQFVLKHLSGSQRSDDCGVQQPTAIDQDQSAEDVGRSDSKVNLGKFYQFLIAESKLCRREQSPMETADQTTGDVRQQVITQASPTKSLGDKEKLTKGIPDKECLKESNTTHKGKENDSSISESSLKFDFNRAYLSMLAAANVKSSKAKEKSKEKRQGRVLDEPSADKTQPLDEDVIKESDSGSSMDPTQDLPQPQGHQSDAAAVSEMENVGCSREAKDPQDNESIDTNFDSLPGTSTEENMETSSLDKDQGQMQEGAQPTPLLTLDGSKQFGVDFQAIAQRASQTNPEATTITVVQHTGGNRPPMTIHFKKSHKSEAIIPTGESLGIESPFLRKNYVGSKIFACKECHARYKTANELERHVVKKHQKQKSFLCEICGDALATRGGMKIHMERKHTEIKFQTCDICDYTTRSTTRLKTHIKKHNKETSEFLCKPCKKSFVSASKLRQHEQSPMHKNSVDPIICEHCGYVTKKRDNFLVHLRKHTGEKPYKCSHCDYASADGSTLKRHVMAVHSTIRPFRCSQCQFSCVDKKGLRIHMRKHTGERPFTCDLCPYAAKRSGALNIHRRTHLHEKTSVSSSNDGLTADGAAEVASYVDISHAPSGQVPSVSSIIVTRSYSSQRPAQPSSTTSATAIPPGHQGISNIHSSAAPGQISTQVISSQGDQSVISYLYGNLCHNVKGQGQSQEPLSKV